MGEAKRRGTFEERKKEAIDAGRIKKSNPRLSKRKIEKIAWDQARAFLPALMEKGWIKP